MGRATWQKNIIIKFFPITQWPRKSKLIHRLLTKIRNLPIIWDLLRMTPMGGDYGHAIPPDRVITINETLDSQGSVILPNQIVDYFIDKAKYHVVMNYCLCRHSNKCHNFPELGCVFLGEAALKINPEQGRRVTKEEAMAHVKKTRKAGLIHMIGKLWMDSKTHGTSPGDKFMTICSCCSCCCITGILKYMPKQLTDRYPKLSGIKVTVTDRCKGCGTCVNVCFGDQIQIKNNKAKIGPECRGCGRCVDICPQKAIELTITDEKFFEKAVQRLSAVVDVE